MNRRSRPKARFNRLSSRLPTRLNSPIPHQKTQGELVNFFNAEDRKRHKVEPAQRQHLLESQRGRESIDDLRHTNPLPGVFQADLQYQSRGLHTRAKNHSSKTISRPKQATSALKPSPHQNNTRNPPLTISPRTFASGTATSRAFRRPLDSHTIFQHGHDWHDNLPSLSRAYSSRQNNLNPDHPLSPPNPVDISSTASISTPSPSTIRSNYKPNQANPFKKTAGQAVRSEELLFTPQNNTALPESQDLVRAVERGLNEGKGAEGLEYQRSSTGFLREPERDLGEYELIYQRYQGQKELNKKSKQPKSQRSSSSSSSRHGTDDTHLARESSSTKKRKGGNDGVGNSVDGGQGSESRQIQQSDESSSMSPAKPAFTQSLTPISTSKRRISTSSNQLDQSTNNNNLTQRKNQNSKRNRLEKRRSGTSGMAALSDQFDGFASFASVSIRSGLNAPHHDTDGTPSNHNSKQQNNAANETRRLQQEETVLSNQRHTTPPTRTKTPTTMSTTFQPLNTAPPSMTSNQFPPSFYITEHSLRRTTPRPRWMGEEWEHESVAFMDFYDTSSSLSSQAAPLYARHRSPSLDSLYNSSGLLSNPLQYDTLHQLRDHAEVTHYQGDDDEEEEEEGEGRDSSQKTVPRGQSGGQASNRRHPNTQSQSQSMLYSKQSKRNFSSSNVIIPLATSSSLKSSNNPLRTHVQNGFIGANNQLHQSPTFQSLASSYPASNQHSSNHPQNPNNQYYNYSNRSNTMTMGPNNSTSVFNNQQRRFSSSNRSLIYHSSPHFAGPTGFGHVKNNASDSSSRKHAYNEHFYKRNTNYNYDRPQTNLFDKIPTSTSTTAMAHFDDNNQIVRTGVELGREGEEEEHNETTNSPKHPSRQSTASHNKPSPNYNPSHWNLIYYSRTISPHHKYSPDTTTVEQHFFHPEIAHVPNYYPLSSTSPSTPARHYLTLHDTQPFAQSSFVSTYAPDKYSGNPKAKLHKAPKGHRFTAGMSREERTKQIEIDHENGNGYNTALNSIGVGVVM